MTSATQAERDFKQAVRRLLARSEYPLPGLINAELGRDKRPLNGREFRWRREVCAEMHVELATLRTLIPTELPPASAAPPAGRVNPLNDAQRRAFYAKAGTIERALKRSRGSERDRALAAVSAAFGRQIESVNDLTSREASWILDKLTEEVDELAEQGLVRY